MGSEETQVGGAMGAAPDAAAEGAPTEVRPEAAPKPKSRARAKPKAKSKSATAEPRKPVMRAGGYVDYGDGRGWRLERRG